MPTQTKLAVILHADVAGSTSLVQKNEQLAHERINDTFRRFSRAILEAGGTAHEIRGDALVAEFDRASAATNAALSFQVENTAHNDGLIGEIRPELRVGIAIGEVVIGDNMVTGAGVVLAQRIEQLAAPGTVCISAAVREAIPERLAGDFFDRGEQMLKGFDRPQRVFIGSRSADSKPVMEASEPGRVGQPANRPSIVVLPFANAGAGADSDFLADGLTEDITTTLSCQRWLLVISKPSAVEVAERISDLKLVGEELEVRYVLTGNVRQSGQRIRVTSTLSEAASGRQLWSNRYDRVLEDIFDLQDDIARSIVGELVPELTSADLDRISGLAPDNLGAWEAYQRGLAELNHQSAESFERAKEYFQAAMNYDPSFSSARAYYGYALVRQLLWRLVPLDAVEELFEVAEKAVSLDPRDSSAHVVRGLAILMQGQPDTAIREMDEALRLNPSSAFVYVMRAAVKTFGFVSHEDALQDLDSAARLSPTDRFDRGQRMAAAACANFFLGNYEEAARTGEEAWRAGGMFGGFYGVVAHMALDRSERAQHLAREILARHPQMSVAFFRDAMFYVRDHSHFESVVALAAKAGIPLTAT